MTKRVRTYARGAPIRPDVTRSPTSLRMASYRPISLGLIATRWGPSYSFPFPYTLHSGEHSNKRIKQEAQLMLTNPRDAFRGQSRSPNNIVPFHMLRTVSPCAIVILSLIRAVFTIFDFKKYRDLEIRVRGHSRSLKVVPFDRLRTISY